MRPSFTPTFSCHILSLLEREGGDLCCTEIKKSTERYKERKVQRDTDEKGDHLFSLRVFRSRTNSFQAYKRTHTDTLSSTEQAVATPRVSLHIGCDGLTTPTESLSLENSPPEQEHLAFLNIYSSKSEFFKNNTFYFLDTFKELIPVE